MFDTTKKVDIESGKVTYTRTIGEHTATCIASCDKEAEGKLGSKLLILLSLDGIISAVEDSLREGEAEALKDAAECKEHRLSELRRQDAQITTLQQELVAERTKPWYKKLWTQLWNR